VLDTPQNNGEVKIMHINKILVEVYRDKLKIPQAVKSINLFLRKKRKITI